MIAADIQHAVPAAAAQGKPTLRSAFRIQLDQFRAVCRDIGDERNIVLLCHGMSRHMDVEIRIDLLRLYGVRIVLRFSMQRRKRNAAAADDCLSGCMDNIPADRTYIEQRTKHIAALILVCHTRTGEQFGD